MQVILRFYLLTEQLYIVLFDVSLVFKVFQDLGDHLFEVYVAESVRCRRGLEGHKAIRVARVVVQGLFTLVHGLLHLVRIGFLHLEQVFLHLPETNAVPVQQLFALI